MRVFLTDKYPLYSAYVFDGTELWYVPYHQRKNWQPIPVFIFRGQIRGLEIFKDIEDTLNIAPYDLQYLLELGW
ncbi:MAG: hypothetical protein WAM96_21620 [Candidatus Acidiferrales bacterium]